MENPRPEKVAVVDEVKERLGNASAAILTEYRGLKVKDLADLRRALTTAGGEYRTDKVGNIHVPVGKVSFTKDALLANIRTVLDELQRAKPAATKGKYVKSVTLSSTMGPGIKIDPARLRITDEEMAGAA